MIKLDFDKKEHVAYEPLFFILFVLLIALWISPLAALCYVLVAFVNACFKINPIIVNKQNQQKRASAISIKQRISTFLYFACIILFYLAYFSVVTITPIVFGFCALLIVDRLLNLHQHNPVHPCTILTMMIQKTIPLMVYFISLLFYMFVNIFTPSTSKVIHDSIMIDVYYDKKIQEYCDFEKKISMVCFIMMIIHLMGFITLFPWMGSPLIIAVIAIVQSIVFFRLCTLTQNDFHLKNQVGRQQQALANSLIKVQGRLIIAPLRLLMSLLNAVTLNILNPNDYRLLNLNMNNVLLGCCVVVVICAMSTSIYLPAGLVLAAKIISVIDLGNRLTFNHTDDSIYGRLNLSIRNIINSIIHHLLYTSSTIDDNKTDATIQKSDASQSTKNPVNPGELINSEASKESKLMSDDTSGKQGVSFSRNQVIKTENNDHNTQGGNGVWV